MSGAEKMAALNAGARLPRCTHESTRAYREAGDDVARHWICDECGNVEPMTPTQLAFTREPFTGSAFTNTGHEDYAR